MRKRGRLFSQGPKPAQALHPLFGSGNGFAPDVFSESGFQTLPECCGTDLEEEDPIFGQGQFEVANINPPYGREGMMPPPSMETGPLQPGVSLDEEGIGGAGSFLCANAIGAKG